MMFLLPSANLSGRVYGSQDKEDIYKIGTLILERLEVPSVSLFFCISSSRPTPIKSPSTGACCGQTSPYWSTDSAFECDRQWLHRTGHGRDAGPAMSLTPSAFHTAAPSLPNVHDTESASWGVGHFPRRACLFSKH